MANIYPLATTVSLEVQFGPAETGLAPTYQVLDKTGAQLLAPTNVGVFELGGGAYGVAFAFNAPTFNLGSSGYIRWKRTNVDVAPVHYDYLILNQVGTALPGQIFYDRVTDDLGNGLPLVTVNVYLTNTATLLATFTTDAKGEYQIPLTGNLANNQLVDLEFVGSGLQTTKKVGISLV